MRKSPDNRSPIKPEILNAETTKNKKHSWITVLIVGIALTIVGVLLLMLPISQDDAPDAIPASTVKREPFPVEVAEDTEYCTDAQGDFFRNPRKLEEELRAFHSRTGIRPFVYILPKDVEWSSSEYDALVDQKLLEIPDDEPFWLITCVSNHHMMGIHGYRYNNADAIVDDEATSIFDAYLKLNTDGLGKIDEETLGATFAQTAERIMSDPADTTSPAVMIVGGCIAGVIVVTAVILVVRNRRWAKRNAEREEAERTRRLLKKASLERFKDSGLEELEEKYQKVPTPKMAPKKKPKKTPRWASGPTSKRTSFRDLPHQVLNSLKKTDSADDSETS